MMPDEWWRDDRYDRWADEPPEVSADIISQEEHEPPDPDIWEEVE